MHGTISSFLPAGFVFPTAGQCLILAAPFLAIAAVWWMISRTDQIVGHLFPHLEWEHSLGWLNIRAERRASAAMRWVGYAIYVLLVDALCGIVWGAEGLSRLDHWSDPWVMGDLALRVPAFVFCLGIWIFYLGGGLLPKLRAQREAAEFKRFRAGLDETEQDREMQPRSRFHSSLPKPRTNTPQELLVPDRNKFRGQPGG